MRKRNAFTVALIGLCAPLLQAQTTEFFDLVQNGSPADVQAAIAKGANVKAKGDNDATPLLLAAQNNNNPEVIKVLVNAGADLNAKDTNGCTPLVGNLENTKPNPAVILALVTAGADTNAGDNNGYTPLLLALQKKLPADLIGAFLKAGASAKPPSRRPQPASSRCG